MTSIEEPLGAIRSSVFSYCSTHPNCRCHLYVLEARDGHENEFIMWSDSTEVNVRPECILAQVPLAACKPDREKTVDVFAHSGYKCFLLAPRGNDDGLGTTS